MEVSTGFPIFGEPIARFGIDLMVEAVRDSGLDGIWVGDHLALSRADRSTYPGKASGKFFLEPESSWYEAVTALAYIAALAGPLELGFGVALPTLRPPLVIAKQLATLACLAKADVVFGAGAGWMRAEFEAAGVPYEGRGRRLDDAITVIREYWKGEPASGQYGHYAIPEGVTTYPVPPRPIPVLIGGMSEAALSRAVRLGDGWIAALQDWDNAPAVMAKELGRFRALWNEHRRGEVPLVGLVGPIPRSVWSKPDFEQRIAERLETYADLGVDKLVMSIGWHDLEQVRQVLGHIGAASVAVRESRVTGTTGHQSPT